MAVITEPTEEELAILRQPTLRQMAEERAREKEQQANSDAPSTSRTNDGSASRPAGPAEPSFEERAKELERLPLFMKALPTDGSLSPEEQASMDALHSLLYEGDAEERAQNFKSQANDLFKTKKYKEAIGFYSKGLEGANEPELKEETKRTLWANRAACHLALGNYGQCLRDCGSLLTPTGKPIPAEDAEQHRSTTLKALFRCTKALIALEKLDDASDALAQWRREGGPDGDPAVTALEKQIKEKREYKAKLLRERTERERRENEGDAALEGAIRGLGLALEKGWSAKSAKGNCPAEIKPPHFDPDSLDPSSSASLPLASAWTAPSSSTPIIFPVFLLRPLLSPPTRDLILSFHIDTTFGDQLDAFNAQSKPATDPALDVIYAVTKGGRILKVGRKLTLRNIISAAIPKEEGKKDGLELVEGWCLEFYVMQKGDGEKKWIEEMKRRVKA